MLKMCCVGLIGVLALAGCGGEDTKARESPLFKACMDSVSTKELGATQQTLCTCVSKNATKLSTDLSTVLTRYFQAPTKDEASKELTNVPPIDRDKVMGAMQCTT